MAGGGGVMPWAMGESRYRKDESDPATYARPDTECCQGADYTPDEIEFMAAMENYKREHRRPYPDFREVLAVAESLGYRRVGEPRAWVTGEGSAVSTGGGVEWPS
jgi:hypothetical protein